MMTNEFHSQVLLALEKYSTKKVDRYFKFLESKEGGDDKKYYEEIYRRVPNYPCLFYQYLACAVKVLRAKQCLECGADKGVSALMMASEGARVYSIDKRNGWEFVPKDFKRITKLVGETTDLKLLEGVNLSQTDLWLFDSDHTNEQVGMEYLTYKPYFKKGAVLIFDDIEGYIDTWKEIEGDKIESREIHGGNVGVIIV